MPNILLPLPPFAGRGADAEAPPDEEEAAVAKASIVSSEDASNTAQREMKALII